MKTPDPIQSANDAKAQRQNVRALAKGETLAAQVNDPTGATLVDILRADDQLPPSVDLAPAKAAAPKMTTWHWVAVGAVAVLAVALAGKYFRG